MLFFFCFLFLSFCSCYNADFETILNIFEIWQQLIINLSSVTIFVGSKIVIIVLENMLKKVNYVC